MANARRTHPHLAYADSVMQACADAEVVVLLTEWGEFRALRPELLGKVVAARNIVDARHALDAAEWWAAGWRHRALGRPDRS